MPADKTLSAGDSIIFAQASSDAGADPRYVQHGDSVCVSLTEVIDLEETDPATGQALFRFSWQPLGQIGTVAERVGKSRGTHRPAKLRPNPDPKLRELASIG
jgi:hypothetical protein